jgi:hypothetical protein
MTFLGFLKYASTGEYSNAALIFDALFQFLLYNNCQYITTHIIKSAFLTAAFFTYFFLINVLDWNYLSMIFRAKSFLRFPNLFDTSWANKPSKSRNGHDMLKF